MKQRHYKRQLDWRRSRVRLWVFDLEAGGLRIWCYPKLRVTLGQAEALHAAFHGAWPAVSRWEDEIHQLMRVPAHLVTETPPCQAFAPRETGMSPNLAAPYGDPK